MDSSQLDEAAEAAIKAVQGIVEGAPVIIQVYSPDGGLGVMHAENCPGVDMYLARVLDGAISAFDSKGRSLKTALAVPPHESVASRVFRRARRG